MFTASATGKVSSIKVYCGVSANVGIAIYTVSGSAPGTLLASAFAYIFAGDWREISLGTQVDVVNGTTYFLCVQTDTTGGFKQEALSGNWCSYAQAYGAFPSGVSWYTASGYLFSLQGWGTVPVNIEVSAVLATADGAVLAPTITAEINVTVSAVLAAADSAAGVPSVTAGQGTDVSPPLVEITSEFPVPSVYAGIPVYIDVTLIQIAAEGYAPSLFLEQYLFPFSASEAGAEIPVPAITTEINCIIAASLAEVSADLQIPGVTTTSNATITTTLPTVDAAPAVPSVSAGVTIAAITATADAAAPAPTFTTWAGITITAPLATATAEAFYISLTVLPHLILAGSYFEESQEVNRVFVVGVDSNGAIVTGSVAQEVP